MTLSGHVHLILRDTACLVSAPLRVAKLELLVLESVTYILVCEQPMKINQKAGVTVIIDDGPHPGDCVFSLSRPHYAGTCYRRWPVAFYRQIGLVIPSCLRQVRIE